MGVIEDDATLYDGVLCLVMEVSEKNDPSRVISKKWENSQLNGWVLSKIKGMEMKVALMKRDYLH